jgi:4a-hydroxytetrahydrobiopterin dehydratase
MGPKAFMNEVADECVKQRHHPEWSNVLNRTSIRWTTHRPKGLSLKDAHMARFCDEAATRHGELNSQMTAEGPSEHA